ncbi:MAG TPA: hypothetical protein VNY09_05840 [Candidatus Sulfotelmatobacter sp.]|nr:hypothetical protein [Candidatus Sulfotelmatobacter sp.]
MRNRSPENTSSKPGRKEPLGSVERVNLREQVDRWVSCGLAWVVRKLFAHVLGNARQGSAPTPRETRSAVPLHRDPWCGTYVSSEISFPLEQSGQVLHFCSDECRARYRGTARRAASA